MGTGRATIPAYFIDIMGQRRVAEPEKKRSIAALVRFII
jgi:hypothetical protein